MTPEDREDKWARRHRVANEFYEGYRALVVKTLSSVPPEERDEMLDAIQDLSNAASIEHRGVA